VSLPLDLNLFEFLLTTVMFRTTEKRYRQQVIWGPNCSIFYSYFNAGFHIAGKPFLDVLAEVQVIPNNNVISKVSQFYGHKKTYCVDVNGVQTALTPG
jgi:hypothetical protein